MERLSINLRYWANVNRNRLVFVLFFVATAALVLAGCDVSRSINPTNHNFVETATWNASTSTLEVNGHAKGDGTRIDFTNSQTKQVVGSTMVTNQHYWKFKLENPEVVPCNIDINGGGNAQTVVVKNAPASCNNVSSRKRGLPAVKGLVKAGARAVAQPNLPDGRIIAPGRDLTISPGTAVTFSAIAASPASAGAVQYLWNFEGAAPNSTTQNPGDVVFNVPGIYHVTLIVANSAGVDASPATRIITVTAPPTAVPAGNQQLTAPIANIDTPVGTQFIQVGDTLFFSGSGYDPTGTPNTALQFLWDFQSAAPSSTLQTPGAITFTQPGFFIVSLVVTDSAGNRSLNNPSVSVMVGNQIAANLPPVGAILAPPADMTVLAGTTLFFQGSGTDPDANIPLQFTWDLAGAAPNSSQQNPGMIPFLTPGTYNVRLVVTDSQGQADVNPPVRVINVVPAAGSITNNDFPDSAIIEPAGNLTILAGGSVKFVGQGTTPNPANNPLVFMWEFGDPAIPKSLVDAPPAPVVFPNPGVFTVTLNVADALGQVDPTPAQVIVTVLDPATSVLPPTPGATPPGTGATPGIGNPAMPTMVDADIDLPAGPQRTFGVGEPINFIGSAEGGTPPYQFMWNFGDPNIPDMLGDVATVAYLMPGEYTVTLNAVDSNGIADPNPPQKLVMVVDGTPGGALAPIPGGGAVGATPGAGAVDVPPGSIPTVAPNAPLAVILSPAGNMTITVGQTVEIVGTGIDPNGLELAYFWDIDSAGTSTVQNPGMVTFTRIGMQEINLTVENTNGLRGTASVVINVVPPTGDAPPP